MSPSTSQDDARDIVVRPVGNETGLRRWAWVADNQRRVDEMSGGRLAYVWLPNTGQGGYSYFNRMYFAQQDREGAIIDERNNGGGSAANDDSSIETSTSEPTTVRTWSSTSSTVSPGITRKLTRAVACCGRTFGFTPPLIMELSPVRPSVVISKDRLDVGEELVVGELRGLVG